MVIHICAHSDLKPLVATINQIGAHPRRPDDENPGRDLVKALEDRGVNLVEPVDVRPDIRNRDLFPDDACDTLIGAFEWSESAPRRTYRVTKAEEGAETHVYVAKVGNWATIEIVLARATASQA